MQQFGAYLTTAGDAERASLWIGDGGIFREAQQVVGGGLHVFWADGCVGDITTDGIAAADDFSLCHSATCEDGRVDAGPVMSGTSAWSAVDLWSASVFAGAEHECFVEKPAIVQVGDECRPGLVEDGQQVIAESGEVIGVCIPDGGAVWPEWIPEH